MGNRPASDKPPSARQAFEAGMSFKKVSLVLPPVLQKDQPSCLEKALKSLD
jgi:hypothetical protein